jgi:hypothetical protein
MFGLKQLSIDRNVMPANRLFIGFAVLFLLLLAVLPGVQERSVFEATFAESGPFERVALVAWACAAGFILLQVRPLGPRAWAGFGLCTVFCLREADFQKVIEGVHLSKLSFYVDGSVALWIRSIAASVTLLIVALMVVALVSSYRFIRRGGLETRTGRWLFIGFALIPFTKTLDRSANVLRENFGLVLGEQVKLYLTAFEEGLEALVPLVFLLTIWLSQHESAVGQHEPGLPEVHV